MLSSWNQRNARAPTSSGATGSTHMISRSVRSVAAEGATLARKPDDDSSMSGNARPAMPVNSVGSRVSAMKMPSRRAPATSSS